MGVGEVKHFQSSFITIWPTYLVSEAPTTTSGKAIERKGLGKVLFIESLYPRRILPSTRLFSWKTLHTLPRSPKPMIY